MLEEKNLISQDTIDLLKNIGKLEERSNLLNIIMSAKYLEEAKQKISEYIEDERKQATK